MHTFYLVLHLLLFSRRIAKCIVCQCVHNFRSVESLESSCPQNILSLRGPTQVHNFSHGSDVIFLKNALAVRFPPYGDFLSATMHPYGRSVRCRETLFHVVLFSKCMYAVLQNVRC